MTAATSLRRPEWLGHSHPARMGVSKALRGSHWYPGWVMVAHNDRLMPYPDGGFDNAITVANGGPLPVAGADANGGLRVIAHQPNVQFAITADTDLSVETVVSGGKWAVIVRADVTAHSANDVERAVRGHAHARELIDIAHTGTGAGLVALFVAADAPHVRIAGVARAEVDASSEVADVELGAASIGAMVEAGEYGLFIDGDDRPTAIMGIKDNQTATYLPLPLMLPVRCVEQRDDLAFCRVGQVG
jgi:hypothetical protein